MLTFKFSFCNIQFECFLVVGGVAFMDTESLMNASHLPHDELLLQSSWVKMTSAGHTRAVSVCLFACVCACSTLRGKEGDIT